MTARKSSAARRSPNSLGTVRQLPSGRWRASYRRDGREFVAPATFTQRTEADAWLAGEFADRARGTWRDPDLGSVTLATFATDWLATRGDLSPRTHDLYERNLHTWLLCRVGQTEASRGINLGAMSLADITAASVRAWYAAALTEARTRYAAHRCADRTARVHPARLWARSRGFEVPDTGRLSPALLNAWQHAGCPTPHSAAVEVPENAGRAAVTNAYRLLRTVLNVAVSDELIDRNPCKIKGAGESRSAERGTASASEVAALAAHMPRRLAAAVTLAAWSGLRAGELFALARRHVDIAAGTITVERAMREITGQPITFGATKTAKSRRTVHLPGFVMSALADHLAEFTGPDPAALVFTLDSGEPVSTPRRSILFGRARAAIDRRDLTWHDLRHTGATLAYRAGASVPEVQRRLGHTTMRAAQVYAHAVDGSDRALAARLNDLYSAEATAPHLRAVS